MSDGQAKITITGDATGLKTATGQAENALKNVDKAGKSAGEQFQQTTGKVLGVAGALGAAIGSIKRAVDAFFEARNAARELDKELNNLRESSKIKIDVGLSEAQETLKEATKRIEENRQAILDSQQTTEAFLSRLMSTFTTLKGMLNPIERLRIVWKEIQGTQDLTLESQQKMALLDTERDKVITRLADREKSIADLKQKQVDDERRSLAMKNEALRAELAGGSAKKEFDDNAKLQEILRQSFAETDAYKKKLLMEQFDLQVELNKKLAFDDAMQRYEAWAKTYADQQEKIKADAKKKLEDDKKAARELVEYEAKLREDMLGSLHGDLGGIEYSGRGSVTNWGSER